MNFQGRVAHCLGAEEKITLEVAVVTAERIALDWSQDGRIGYLIARSVGGSHFQGRYGYPQEKSDFECELTLFSGQHEDLLFGTWRERDTDRGGTLAFRLPTRMTATAAPQADDLPGAESALAADVATGSPAEALPIAPRATTVAPAARPVSPAGGGLPKERPIAAPVSSAQVDHLLAITADEFDKRDREQVVEELSAAPVSALFKLAHNALATDLRALAARMFADRYGAAGAAGLPARAPRRAESPEMRAQKRRSSRHGRDR